MKKINRMIGVLLIAFHFGVAQQPDYKVVFDMSTRDTLSQQALFRELSLITKENPAAQLEVVFYGQAINMTTKATSQQAQLIQDLSTHNNVSFKVCAFTMRRNNITENQLVPGIQIVQDGIYEIVNKQHAGWGYIKVAH